MTLLKVQHVTTYAYRNAVTLGDHRMMLRPRSSYDQRLLSMSLKIDPEPARMRWIHDAFDNAVMLASFDSVTKHLRVESEVVLEHTPTGGPEFEIEEKARTYPFTYDFEEIPDLARSIERNYRDQNGDLDQWVRKFLKPDRPTETGQLLMTLTYAIKEGFSYERRDEPGVQSPLYTLSRRKGSCRDFAVLMMEAARALGLAARFVSGYLYVPDRDQGERYLGGGSTHAWCQVYLPGAGWVQFDPTNGIVGSRDLVRVAVARNANQAIPLSGLYYGKRDDEDGMHVTVNVNQISAAEVPPMEPMAGIAR
ncbi:MAG: transglutaminase family protein [Beijerinckiaceae bacterium]